MAAIVVTIICYWYVDHRRLAKARQEYESTDAQYRVGLLPSILDLCDASKTLADAQERSWFVAAVYARAGHFLRVTKMEAQWRKTVELAEFVSEDDRKAAQKELLELERRRAEARDWLEEALNE